jgi:hypothetical protein
MIWGRGWSLFFCMWISSCSPLNDLITIVKNHSCTELVLDFHSYFFWSLSLNQYHLVLIIIALYLSLKSGTVSPPILFLFFKIIFGYLEGPPISIRVLGSVCPFTLQEQPKSPSEKDQVLYSKMWILAWFSEKQLWMCSLVGFFGFWFFAVL